MASGQQVAEENVRKFTAWVAFKTDDDFRSMVLRGVLSRTDIAAECGFAMSVLSQNPRIRDSLKDLEAGLRERGVLPKPAAEPAGGPVEPRTRQAEGVGTVLCTRNLWAVGLQNGSLGTIVDVEDMPRALHDGAGDVNGFALAWVEWDDGQRRPLTLDMLEDVELGYAITVHKAQGSQWPRIIVPVTQSRLFDRTLLYTALTRAQTQVLLVGDVGAAKAAVLAQPRASERRVALDLHLARLGQSIERNQPDLPG